MGLEISPRAKRWIAAVAIAAQLFAFSQKANAAASSCTAWEDVQTAEENYGNNPSPENEEILMRALEDFTAKLRQDAANLPEGSEERKAIEARIITLTEQLNAISAKAKSAEVRIPPEVAVAVNKAASEILSGTYDYSEPLTVVIKGEKIVLLTPDELKQVAKSVEKIKNLELKRRVLITRMLAIIIQKPDVVKKFPK